MRSLRLLVVVVLAVLMVASMFQPAAAHVGTLDQEQAAIDSAEALSSGLSDGQTFKAGLTGDLTEVDLAIGCRTSAVGVTTCASYAPVTVEIHFDSPAGAPLGSTSLPGSAFPNYYPSVVPSAFVTFTFSPPLAVVAGSVYAIVITTTDTSGYSIGVGYAYPPYGHSYPDGTYWFKVGTEDWAPVADQALAFKTYVSVSRPGAVGGVITTVNTLSVLAPWLAVIGLVGCIGTVVVVAKKHR